MPPKPDLLGLDWGTTSLRGYLLRPGGQVLDARTTNNGILQVKEADFAGALTDLAADWLSEHPDLPIVASGMIGSRQGWMEAPYVDVPAGPDDLQPVRYDGFTRPIHFVPGLARRDANGIPDVMRGEETQIIGASVNAGSQYTDDGLYLLPGSHSKWAEVNGGRISWFATFMTGELFAALREHTILGRMMAGDTYDAAAFARGVDYGQQAIGILQRLFSARTLALFEELPESAVSSYLSGLLLGAEIAEARSSVDNQNAQITVIGAADLSSRYTAALAQCGLAAKTAPPGAAARGQWRIASAAGLLQNEAS